MKNIVDYIKNKRRLCWFIILYSIDFLWKIILEKNDGNDLLLVRLDAIGDFVLWLDAAKEFRQLYPDKKIVLCANSIWSDLACGLTYWDEVWPIDVLKFEKNLVYRFKIFRQIRNRGFDTAIQPTVSRIFAQGDSIIRMTGAGLRIGSTGDLSNTTLFFKLIADKWYTRLVSANNDPLMELERNAEFIRNLSGKSFAAGLPILPKRNVCSDILIIKEAYFVLFPGASWLGKQWPAERFAEIAGFVHDKFGWLPVLCGGSQDRSVCQSVSERCRVPVRDLSGSTTLQELIEVIRGARILIGNDTSAIHFAVAVSVPSVCILGGGHYGRFMPYPENIRGTKPVVANHEMPCYHCNWQCTQPHEDTDAVPCITGISVSTVMSKIDLSLSR